MHVNETVATVLWGLVAFVLAPFWPWWLHDKHRTTALFFAGVQALIPLALLLLLTLWLNDKLNNATSSSVESGAGIFSAVFLIGPLLIAWLIFTSMSFFGMLTVPRRRARKSET